MNNPPPIPPTSKKGISGLAIAGFGCGGLIVVILIVGFIFVGKACNMVQEYAGDISKNPAKAAAMIVLRMNPELEVVSTDDTKNEATIKIKKTGETYTMSFDDIKNGKLTMRDSSGQEISIDGSRVSTEGKVVIKGKDGEEAVVESSGTNNGQMKIKSKEGEVTIGGASVSDLPSWVPVYPGASNSQGGGMKSEKDGVVNGAIALESADAVNKIKEFYEAQLKSRGFKVESNEISADGKQTIVLNSTNDSTSSKVNVMASTEAGKTAVMINYSGPTE